MSNILAVLQGLTQDLNAEQVHTIAAASNGQLSDEEAVRLARQARDRAEAAKGTLALLEQGEWEDHGACKGIDPDLFFPARGASTREAKSVCGDCPVVVECGVSSILSSEKIGIWGGMSERERRRLRRKLAKWSEERGLDKPSITHVSSISAAGAARFISDQPVKSKSKKADEEDEIDFSQQFRGILAEKQLELVRHLLRFGPGGLILPEADGMVQFARMLGIGTEALEAQRLGPLLANGRVVQQIEGGKLRLSVSKAGRLWFRNSGMKPMPALQSPTSQPVVVRRVPVAPPTIQPRVPDEQATGPTDDALQSGESAPPPVPAVAAGPMQGKAGTEMAELESPEDFGSEHLKVLQVLATKSFHDDSGRASSLLLAVTGLNKDLQNRILRELEAAGLVERHGSSTRTHDIEITDKGRQWLSLAVDPPAGAGQAPAEAISSASVPVQGGEPAAPAVFAPGLSRSAAGQAISEAARLLGEYEVDMQERWDAAFAEVEELRAKLAAVTAERDELLEADKLRQARLAELKAERERVDAETAALS